MPNEEEVVDQPEATQESAEAVDTAIEQDGGTEEGATEGVNDAANQQGKTDAPEGQKQEDFIGDVPKELEPLKKTLLNKFYAKTREVAAEKQGIQKYQKDAETLQQLMAYKPFQEWYNTQKNGEAGNTTAKSLSEEELEQIRQDPAKLEAYLTKKLESMVEDKYGSQMKSVQEKAADMEVAKEYESTEAKYGEEFEIAHKAGDLDAYYDKGMDFKTAYAVWRLENGKLVSSSEVDKVATDKAAQMINRSKSGSTEKPSSGGGKLPNLKPVKAKGFSDAFDQAFEAVMKNQKVKIETGG